jgi:hypothetical protein
VMRCLIFGKTGVAGNHLEHGLHGLTNWAEPKRKRKGQVALYSLWMPTL